MISIIIPVYNEDESIVILHGEILNVAQLHHLDVEILFVDDGSITTALTSNTLPLFVVVSCHWHCVSTTTNNRRQTTIQD